MMDSILPSSAAFVVVFASACGGAAVHTVASTVRTGGADAQASAVSVATVAPDRAGPRYYPDWQYEPVFYSADANGVAPEKPGKRARAVHLPICGHREARLDRVPEAGRGNVHMNTPWVRYSLIVTVLGTAPGCRSGTPARPADE